LNSPGKSAHYALRQIQKPSSLKKVDLRAKQSASASHVMFAKSVLNTRSHMMSVLESGVASPSVSVAVLSAALHKRAAYFTVSNDKFPL
jgi:hypothetical protein